MRAALKKNFAPRILEHTYRCVGSKLVQPELGPLTQGKKWEKIRQLDYLEAQKNPKKKIDKYKDQKKLLFKNKMLCGRIKFQI